MACEKMFDDKERVFTRYQRNVIQVDKKCYERHFKWSRELQ